MQLEQYKVLKTLIIQNFINW